MNIDAAGQLAFVAHDALGGDYLPAMKTCAVDDVVAERVLKVQCRYPAAYYSHCMRLT
jgi:hypothetical protein